MEIFTLITVKRVDAYYGKKSKGFKNFRQDRKIHVYDTEMSGILKL